MAGRHRRPPAWQRAFSSSIARLLRSRQRARQAALVAEVIGLRVTVAEMREALAVAETRTAELASQVVAERAQLAEAREQLTAAREQLTAAREQIAAPAQGPALPPRSLELPLVQLALTRTAELPLTRDMAEALVAPDRGEDTADTEIVLADLPERPLLDPKADRDSEPIDHAVADQPGEQQPAERPQETERRIA